MTIKRFFNDLKFVILSCDKNHLVGLIPHLKDFLANNLKLELHSRKTIISKLFQGIDFLGYVVFPYHILLRAKTRKRMIKNIRKNIRLLKNGEISELTFKQSLQSYLGILKHCRGQTIQNQIIHILKENNIDQKLYPLPKKK